MLFTKKNKFEVSYLLVLLISLTLISTVTFKVKDKKSEANLGLVSVSNKKEGLNREAFYFELVESKKKTGPSPLRLDLEGKERILVGQGQKPKESNQILVSKREYEILARIVEAEAGTESRESRLMIANVILNRVESPKFPNTIEEVVFEKNNGYYQFQPISNGFYYKVNVQDSTKEVVAEALGGNDNSKGALFFMVRRHATAKNISWFENNLTKVTQIDEVEYYK